MYLITFIAIIAVSSAAQLPAKNYLPQNQGPSGIQNHGSSFQGSSSSTSSFSQNHQSQSFQNSQSTSFGGSSGSGDTGNRRPQQEEEKKAAVLKQDQEVNENGDYHYAYETSNGIRAEEAGNTVESSGGFSYKGDDGITYTVTFTAGEGGFRPQGNHLPVPPPTPQEILEALEQNAKDEAAGIFDDGKYHPDSNGNGKGQNGKAPGSGSFGSSSAGSFGSSSSGSFGSSSSQSSSSQFGSSNHQGSFNSNSGYSY